MSAPHHGRFLWFDLMSTEPVEAIAFYNAVMDWKTELWEGGDAAYRMFAGPNGAVGGCMPMPETAKGAPQHWIGHIGAEDVDQSVDLAVKLGAKVLMPTFKMDKVGRFAVLGDPFGAVFSIFQPEVPTTEAFDPKIGDMCWHDLMSSDPEAALAFYSELFGWVKTNAMNMGPAGIYQMYGPNADTTYGGVMKGQPGMPSAWMYYTKVADLDASVATINAKGGQLLIDPKPVPGGGRIAVAKDPQGGAFALYSDG